MSSLRQIASPAVLAAAAIFLVACTGGDPATPPVSGEFACTPSDVGNNYLMLVEGEVSVRNLADLSDDAAGRELELRSAGLRGGRFSYWKERVGRPPFDPPGEVLCQALEFGSPAEAGRFVSDFAPVSGDLATTAMNWLPRENRDAAELDLPTPSALPAGARAFRLTASGSGSDVELYVVMAPNGRYVQSAHVSGSSGLDAAVAVLGSVAGRTQLLAASR